MSGVLALVSIEMLIRQRKKPTEITGFTCFILNLCMLWRLWLASFNGTTVAFDIQAACGYSKNAKTPKKLECYRLRSVTLLTRA